MTAAHRERVGRDHCKTAVIIRGGDVCSQVAIFEKTENVLKEDRRMSCNWQCVAVVLNSFRKGPDSRYFRHCTLHMVLSHILLLFIIFLQFFKNVKVFFGG